MNYASLWSSMKILALAFTALFVWFPKVAFLVFSCLLISFHVVLLSHNAKPCSSNYNRTKGEDKILLPCKGFRLQLTEVKLQGLVCLFSQKPFKRLNCSWNTKVYFLDKFQDILTFLGKKSNSTTYGPPYIDKRMVGSHCAGIIIH